MGAQASKAGQVAMFSELLGQHVHFSMEELHQLYDRFKRLSKSSATLPKSEFERVLEGSVFEAGSPFIRRMVDVLDEDHNDEIDFREFALVSFRCFDLDGNGGISEQELTQVLLSMAKTVRGAAKDIVETGLHEAIGGGARGDASGTGAVAASPAPSAQGELEAEVARFVHDAFERFDANRDGLLQRDEYRAACATHPFMLAMFKAQVVRHAPDSGAAGTATAAAAAAPPSPAAPPGPGAAVSEGVEERTGGRPAGAASAESPAASS